MGRYYNSNMYGKINEKDKTDHSKNAILLAIML